MSPERWRQIEELYRSAREREPAGPHRGLRRRRRPTRAECLHELTEHLLPRTTNVRRVNVDDATNAERCSPAVNSAG